MDTGFGEEKMVTTETSHFEELTGQWEIERVENWKREGDMGHVARAMHGFLMARCTEILQFHRPHSRVVQSANSWMLQ
jgi:hypothetical protein